MTSQTTTTDTLKSLPARFRAFRDGLCHDRWGRKIYDRVYFIAIDAEWYRAGDRNCILSYQLATVSDTNTVNQIIYLNPGERWTLAQLIDFGVSSVNGGNIPAPLREESSRTLVVMISHNMVAEWSAIKDRDAAYITTKLTSIRKCPVTGIHPIGLHSNTLGSVEVHLYDTMLLAPAGFRSLDKLSSLLGKADERKLNISQYYIEHMNDYLADDPRGFEAYALRDTEVTLKIFITLQETLNALAYGETRHLFKTLASAAVKGFLEMNSWFKSYKDELGDERFNDAYRLILRSYHGGRNEGFIVGDSRDF